jgi:hypothetical protein
MLLSRLKDQKLGISGAHPLTAHAPLIHPTIKHANARASIVLESRAADGRPLPSWLNFDCGTGRFTGTPPSGIQQLVVVVVARDSTGGEAATKVTLSFGATSEISK